MSMRNDNFKFHVPIEIVKGGKDSKTMKLAGIASTSDRDRQGEVLLPEGFDYTYLRDNGYINWHHQLSKNPEAVIGEPTKVTMTKGGLYIEGELYNTPMAEKAFKLASTLEKNSKSRRLGWSIEGKVTQRDPMDESKVTKARITGVALTPMPINKNTLVSIMKAMGAGDDDQMEDVEVNDTTNDSGNGGEQYLLNESISDGGYVRVDQGGEITINLGKAMSTTSGAPVTPESVEGSPRDTQQNYNKQNKILNENDMEVMKKSEAYEHIFYTYPNITIDQARKVMSRIEKNKTK